MHDVRLALVASLLLPFLLQRPEASEDEDVVDGSGDDDEDEDASSSSDEEMIAF